MVRESFQFALAGHLTDSPHIVALVQREFQNSRTPLTREAGTRREKESPAPAENEKENTMSVDSLVHEGRARGLTILVNGGLHRNC